MNDQEKVEYPRSKNEILRDYEITIKFLNRGCVIGVGCKEIAFEDVDNAMNELMEYIKNPLNITDKWISIFKQ
jgi:hypothetical protein